MPINTNYVNADGLEVRWGGVSPEAVGLKIPQNSGEVLKSAYADFGVDGLPGPNLDADANGVATTFTSNVGYIAKGSIVTSAHVIVRTATAGGDLTFSLVDKAGNTLSTLATADLSGNLIAGGASGLLTVGTPVLAQGAYLKVVSTAPLTAGDVRVAICYVDSGVIA